MAAFKKPLYQREAQNDVDGIVEFIAQDNFAAANRFYTAVEETAALLVRTPTMGGKRDFPNRELQNVRFLRVQGFAQYLMFYRETEQTIEVIRIVHGARDLPVLFQ